MTAIFEPQLLHPEQITARKPWERAEGESAKWYMRFRNYLTMGPKRSVHAVFEAERQNKVEKSRGRPGETWYNASKKYQWKIRAEAWDAEQDAQKAALMREIALKSPFVSKPFRIAQLNSMADGLARQIEQGLDAMTFIALTKQLQSLMHDIRSELQEWDIHPDASCDAAALDALRQKDMRLQEVAQSNQDAMDDDMDAMLAKLILQNPGLLPDENADAIADQLEAIRQTKIAGLIKARLGLA